MVTPAVVYQVRIDWECQHPPCIYFIKFSERSNIDNQTWFKYHPYAEWYMNTMRVHGSPSHEFHRSEFAITTSTEIQKL